MTEKIISKTKNATKSWTMWLNLVLAPLLMQLETNSELWKNYFGDSSNALLMFIILANAALRAFKTKGAI